MTRLHLEGVYTALITPFTSDAKQVDFHSLEKLLDAQVSAQIDGVVPIGTTGESPTLTADEKEKIIKLCVEKAKATGGKMKVIAGTGSNNTAATVLASQKAKEWGADAVLIVNPYYNKPSQEGLYQHVKAINEVGIPIVLYNIPGRSSINMTPSTIARIYRDCVNVCAVKEATGSLDQAIEIRSLCDIEILSGDDPLTLPLMSIGGTGVISVNSNFQPKMMKAMANKNDLAAGAEVLRKHFKLIRTMFCEINPVPIKFAMYKAGMIKSPVVRLPLSQLVPENQNKVVAVLKEYNLL